MLMDQYNEDADTQPVLLIVSADREFLEIARFVLEEEFNRYGYRISQSTQPHEVIASFKANIVPSVLMLDLDRADEDGEELLHLLENDRLLSSLPVITFCSAQEMEGELDFSIISEYLVKPLDTDTLISAVWRSIDKGMSEQEGLFNGAWDYTALE